jgi:hypothetical protein
VALVAVGLGITFLGLLAIAVYQRFLRQPTVLEINYSRSDVSVHRDSKSEQPNWLKRMFYLFVGMCVYLFFVSPSLAASHSLHFDLSL